MTRLFAASVFATACAVPALAQTADFKWERAIRSGKEVSVGNISGDIRITTSTSGRVEVRGIKRGDPHDFDRIKASAEETENGVVVCVIYDDPEGSCTDHRSRRDNEYRRGPDVTMNFEIAVPTNLRVSAANVSGDIFVTGAHGEIRVTTVSGDVRVERLHASAIHGTSVSGDIDVQIDEFVGDGDLDFHSVSGDVIIEAPSNFGADVSMSSLSGDVNSDFPLTLSGGRIRRGGIRGTIGSGGRRLEVGTVSGDLRIIARR